MPIDSCNTPFAIRLWIVCVPIDLASSVERHKIGLSRLNPFFCSCNSGWAGSTRTFPGKSAWAGFTRFFFRIKMILKVATKRQMDPIGTFHTHPTQKFSTTNRVEAVQSRLKRSRRKRQTRLNPICSGNFFLRLSVMYCTLVVYCTLVEYCNLVVYWFC